MDTDWIESEIIDDSQKYGLLAPQLFITQESWDRCLKFKRPLANFSIKIQILSWESKFNQKKELGAQKSQWKFMTSRDSLPSPF